MEGSASAVPGIDMAALLTNPEVQQSVKAESPMEQIFNKITPEDAAADNAADAKLEFRELLSDEQRKALKENAPAIADQMVKDYSKIINFGAPVMDKMNQSSIALLNEQKNIKIPEADQIVNNLLREMDGYNAKYKNFKVETLFKRLKKTFGGAGYTIKTMIRDAQPIAKRLEEAELNVRKIELDLEDNAARARRLHEDTLSTMDDTVAVLAALEEISEYLHQRFDPIDAAVQAAGEDETIIEVEGVKYSLSELKERHADLAQGITEVDKSWFSWRQQFFLGYASAPSLRNLIYVSAGLQRQLMVFRTQGIPSARRGLAMWQQAAQAEGATKVGEMLSKGTNQMISDSFGAVASAVDSAAKASQTSLVSEETIFAIIESVKSQVNSLVEADRAGREMRTRSITAMEEGEKAIHAADEEGRRKLVENAVRAARNEKIQSSASVDILGSLGVKA